MLHPASWHDELLRHCRCATGARRNTRRLIRPVGQSGDFFWIAPHWPGLMIVENRLRLNSNLLNRFKLIWVVQSVVQKYFASRFPQISGYLFAFRTHERGVRVVTDVGRGMRWTLWRRVTSDV
jgi:hypothetical protein